MGASHRKIRLIYRGIPPKSKGDWAFISHMLAIAVERKGRVGVVDSFEEEEEIDIAAVQKEIRQIETELAKTEVKMKRYLKKLGF